MTIVMVLFGIFPAVLLACQWRLGLAVVERRPERRLPLRGGLGCRLAVGLVGLFEPSLDPADHDACARRAL